MSSLQKIIASACGIGQIGKGAGSIAAMVLCFIWLLTPLGKGIMIQLIALVFVLITGTWSAGAVEKVWGHDSNKIVIDEVAGMMVSLLLIPVDLKYVAVGFIVFRFFDIAKPFGIRQCERLPGGLGVIADDVLAGIYTQAVLRVIIAVKIF